MGKSRPGKEPRARKKHILYLIEGDSEYAALNKYFGKLYGEIDHNIVIHFMSLVAPVKDPNSEYSSDETGGDITQRRGVTTKNIDRKIVDYYIRPFLASENLMQKDIAEIIHIVDMDGAYIADERIIHKENPTGAKRIYYNDADGQVYTLKADNKKENNERKRQIIDLLCQREYIDIGKKVPYRIFYFSSNLDHFLHHDANLLPKQKTYLAEVFANQINSVQQFTEYFCNDPDSAQGMTYEQSWSFITQSNSVESLKRHTNINLLIEGLLSQIGDEKNADNSLGLPAMGRA